MRKVALTAVLFASLVSAGATPAVAASNPGTGDSGLFTFRPSASVGGTQVNVASGNALVRTRDLADGLVNYHVVVDRAYNSLASSSFSILSPRWAYDVGPATGLTIENGQDVTVAGPSGYRMRFIRQADGSYTPPEGFDGFLTKTPAGWTLARASQNDEFGFDSAGALSWTKDAAAREFTIQGTSAAGRTVLSSYGNTSGRRVNLSYTGDSFVREMDDPSSGHHYYRYTGGRLTQYESPVGAVTAYRYDSSGFLDKITEPGGATVELDTSSVGRVQSITTTLPGGVPQVTSFVYTRRPYKTDVTGPDGLRRTYAYDDHWRVTRQYNPDLRPAVIASGELVDLPAGYTSGTLPIGVRISATEPDGAGLELLALDSDSGVRVAQTAVPCLSTAFDRVCPTNYAADLTADLSGLPEGAHTLRPVARDEEGNLGVGEEPINVVIDRTPPPGVDGVVVDDYDTETSKVTIGIDPADAGDPEVAPGLAGSGLASVDLRWRKPGEAWTAWAALPTFDVNVGEMAIGQQLQVETRAVDHVGNASAVRHDDLVVAAPPPSTVEDSPDPEWPEDETEVGTGSERVVVPVEIDGEPAERDWIVKLNLSGGEVAYASTDEEGVATFTDVAAGTYSVGGLLLDPSTPVLTPESMTVTPSSAPAPRSINIAAGLQAAVDKVCEKFSAEAAAVYCRLGDAEKSYLKDHVRLGLRFLVDGNDAAKTTFRIFDQPANARLDGTKANAFQHAYWVALMTKRTYMRRYDIDLSEKAHGGLDWGEAHEAEDISNPDSYIRKLARMDLHNNAVGARLANESEERRKNNGRLCTGMRRAVFTGKLDATGARSYQQYWLSSRGSSGSGPVVPNPSKTC